MCREDCRLLMNGSPAVRDFGLTLFVRIFKELNAFSAFHYKSCG
jgi:hypothetical protein